MEPLAARLLEKLEVQLARIERSLGRLDEEALWHRPRAGLNSIGNLCLHLAGNENHYVGRVIGGTGYRRDRPAEFDARGGGSRAELLVKLHEARAVSRRVLASLFPEDLDRPVESDYPPQATVLSVLLHVVSHYGYHTGQIVLLARLFQPGDEHVLEWR